jgi:NitT/TauT family transport system substrate-binding protein
MRVIIGGLATLAWIIAAMAPAAAADKVVLMLNWYVYGEHAPFYYGKANVI